MIGRSVVKREQRLRALWEFIAERETVDVRDIVARFGVSHSTARRDLEALSRRHRLTRVHGGALASHRMDDERMPPRPALSPAVVRLGRAAAQMVAPGEVIGLVGGAAGMAIADALLARSDLGHTAAARITVVTPAVDLALRLASHPQFTTVLPGGVLDPSSLQVAGALYDAIVGRVSLEHAFIGCEGFDPLRGAMAHDRDEAAALALMARRSRMPILVVESERLGRRAAATIGDHRMFQAVLTDDDATAAQLARIRAHGYRVVVGR